jgi:hypothetical protein
MIETFIVESCFTEKYYFNFLRLSVRVEDFFFPCRVFGKYEYTAILAVHTFGLVENEGSADFSVQQTSIILSFLLGVEDELFI